MTKARIRKVVDEEVVLLELSLYRVEEAVERWRYKAAKEVSVSLLETAQQFYDNRSISPSA